MSIFEIASYFGASRRDKTVTVITTVRNTVSIVPLYLNTIQSKSRKFRWGFISMLSVFSAMTLYFLLVVFAVYVSGNTLPYQPHKSAHSRNQNLFFAPCASLLLDLYSCLREGSKIIKLSMKLLACCK
jgi:hypothetical protein